MVQFLLLQARDSDDPIRSQEVDCFAHALNCKASAFQVVNILQNWPAASDLSSASAVFIGGSGDYSAADDGEWLTPVLVRLRELCESGKPVFASCWGFQAIARALGGQCIHDPAHAELGTVSLRLTEAGQSDPLFGELPSTFLGHAGHQDHVVKLPPGAVLLASTGCVEQQAFRLADRPVYCTQYHPELTLDRFLERVRAYPQYVEKIAGVPYPEFADSCQETPDSNRLLKRFVELFAVVD